MNQKIIRCILLGCCLAIPAGSTAAAQSWVEVFSTAGQGTPVVRLDRIAPMSEATRAILAMYALQNGAGCSGGRDNFACSLTEALDIGGQCSTRHVALVRAWFPSGLPKMGGYADAVYKDGASESLCYRTPDGATFQRTWRNIRIKVRGKRVFVDARGSWLAREKSGDFRYVTEYRIGEKSVRVISHRGG